MSILYGEELKVSVFEKENFSEYFFQTFKENPESNLLVRLLMAQQKSS